MRLSRALRDPFLVVAYLVLVAFLGLFVVYPLARAALTPRPSDWAKLLSSPRWIAAMEHTLAMTVLSTVTATAMGYAYAYGVTKGRVPGARLFSLVPFLYLVSPPFVGGLAFTLLLGRKGIVTHGLLGLDVSIYGWGGLWLAQTLSFFPISFIICRSALANLGGALETAARGMGAGRFRVFRTVSLPLTAPAIAQAALFCALSVMSDFGNPMLIGGRYRVLATEVYTQLSGWADAGMSAAAGLILLAPALVVFALQRAATGAGERYATVGSRGRGIGRDDDVSPPARLALAAFCGIVAVFVLAQFAVIAYGALTRIWSVDGTFTLAHLGAASKYGREIKDSLAFPALAASLCAAASLASAFLVQRCRAPLAPVIDLATILPAAIPHTLVGLAFAISFNGKPLDLAGSGAILVVAMAVSYLPFGYRAVMAALAQVKPSIDDAAAALGASRSRALFDVILPIVRGAVAAAFVFAFIVGTGTMSAVIFLVSFKTPLASVTILNLAEMGSWSDAAALASILCVLAFAGLAAVRLLAGRRFFQAAFR